MRHGKLVFAALAVLTVSSHSNANFGNLDEVIEAAKNHKSPTYIVPLMQSVYRHLAYFSKNQNIASAKQKTALLKAMTSFFFLAHKDASNVAKQSMALVASAHGTAPGEAFKAARSAAKNSDLAVAHQEMNAMTREACHDYCKPPSKERNVQYERSHESRNRSNELAAQLVLGAAWDSLQNNASVEEAAAIAYYVAEWVFLNELAKQLVWILPEIYDCEIRWLKEVPSKAHPFANETNFNRFVARHRSDSHAAHMIFIEPLLANLDSWSGFSSKFQFFLGGFQERSIVSLLPFEVVGLILSKL